MREQQGGNERAGVPTRFQCVQGVNGCNNVARVPGVGYRVLFAISDSCKLGRGSFEAHGVQRSRKWSAVRVAAPAVCEDRVHTNELTGGRWMRPQATYASLTRHLVERNDSSVDDGAGHVLLQRDFLDLRFGVEIEKQLMLQFENGCAALDRLCFGLS